MPFFLPVAGSVGLTIARTVIVRGGQTLIAYVVIDKGSDKAGELLAEADILDSEEIKDIEDTLQGLGNTIIDATTAIGEEIGSGVLGVIEGIGSAVIDGIDKTYNYARVKISGNEAEAIAALTSTVLILVTGIYIYQTVKKGGSPIL